MITQATLKVRPRPAERRYEGWMFRGFEEGAEAFRALEQGGVVPDVARLSDEAETRLSLALAGEGSLTRRAGRGTWGCVATRAAASSILGFEGDRAEVAPPPAALAARAAASARAGCRSAPAPGRAWERGRYAGPYLRDALLDHGVMAETLETAHSGRACMELYRGRPRGDRERAGGAWYAGARDVPRLAPLSERRVALLHVSRAARSADAELDQWRAVKTRRERRDRRARAGRSPTTTRSAATTLPGCRARSATVGVEVLRAVKQRLDPAGILNPGKLLPGKDGRVSEPAGRILPIERTLEGTLGMEVVEVTDDVVRGRMPVEDRIRQAVRDRPRRRDVGDRRVAHLAGNRPRRHEPTGRSRWARRSTQASCARSAGGHVNALARVRRRGRTAWNWEVEITDDDGRLCALLRATIAVRDAPSGGR